jgi:YesN/AraC family two-component response regulator
MVGRIEVKSNADEQLGETGTTFTIYLPVTRQADFEKIPHTAPKEVGLEPIGKAPQTIEKAARQGKPLCLVIDDNADIVSYLKKLLSGEYEVAIAYNGQRGIEKALVLMPDVIISDVMMPEKDGLEVCDFLKNDQRTSHIPIILLTAKSTIEDRLEGLRRGADAYLQKPFNQKELFISLKKSVELRNRLISYFAHMPFAFQEEQPDLSSIVEPDLVMENEFLQKAKKAVEENISDSQFGIQQLCRLLAMSRAQLHRKLTALTGKSASHFIRNIRLRKAKNLLMTTDQTISEIAYDVGFKDPNYFTRLFSEEFGETPSETRK